MTRLEKRATETATQPSVAPRFFARPPTTPPIPDPLSRAQPTERGKIQFLPTPISDASRVLPPAEQRTQFPRFRSDYPGRRSLHPPPRINGEERKEGRKEGRKELVDATTVSRTSKSRFFLILTEVISFLSLASLPHPPPLSTRFSIVGCRRDGRRLVLL